MKEFVEAIKDPYIKEVNDAKEECAKKLDDKNLTIYMLIRLVCILSGFAKTLYRENSKLKVKNSNTKSLCENCEIFDQCFQNHDIALNNKPMNNLQLNRCFIKQMLTKIIYSINDFRLGDRDVISMILNSNLVDRKEIDCSTQEIFTLDDPLINNYMSCVIKDGDKYFREGEIKFLIDFINGLLSIGSKGAHNTIESIRNNEEGSKIIYDTIKNLVKISEPSLHLMSGNY